MKRRPEDENDEAAGRRGREAPPPTAHRTGLPLLKPGTWFLRRFRVDRLLGQGGMGAVYAVTEKGRTWALKVVRSEFLDDPGQRRRLLREGDVLARMRHPNVVQVQEVGLAGGNIAWYRMELLEGMTLRQELERRGALSLALACATLRAAALGAGHLHAFGGVHRDIKPENLFVLREPRDVKLLDFGLARLAGTPDTLDAQTHGSPLYMAPEQIRDEVPTSATDVYALGLVAYEAIAGFHPFGDARATGRIDALFARHLNDVPPPLLRIGVPEPISDVIARAIAKVPRERHRDGRAFAEALWDAFLATRDAPGARDTNPGEPGISEVLRWGNEAIVVATGPAAPERAAATGPAAPERAEAAVRADDPAAAAAGPGGGAGTRAAPSGQQAGGETAPRETGVGWAMTERLPERQRDPSCVAALAQRALDPPPEQAGPVWVPVEHTVPLPRAATAAGGVRAGTPPAAVPAAAARPLGAVDAWLRAHVTPPALVLGFALGAVLSLLAIDVILRLQGVPPASGARGAGAPTSTSAQGPLPVSAAEAATLEPLVATGTAESPSTARPAPVPSVSASAGAEGPPGAVPAESDGGARRSEGGLAAAPARDPAPAASSAAPPALRPRPKPKRKPAYQHPNFYDEFLE
ncbi:protein kinase [Sorangium sp. So ce1036]|uniref:serine/threonine-protein kinase n=1 Tax=Sorangium sp. So ce1036 TaxID=3133328 RepID=UPI003EFEF595